MNKIRGTEYLGANDRRGPADRTVLTVTGAAASFLLHGLLFTPLLWGSYRHPPHLPPFQGSSASRDALNANEPMIIFNDDSDTIHDLSRPNDQQIPILMPPQVRLAVVGRPDIPQPEVVLSDVIDEQTAELQGDGGGHAMMFGRYVGQISARVGRAWIRPRVSLVAGTFECRVEIKQDSRGNVREVTLKRCTDQPQWQISLVRAIQQASPLPAPPDPAVFSNLLTLEFDSDPYVTGAATKVLSRPRKSTASARRPQTAA